MSNTNITASAHVKDNKLYIMGLQKTPKGAIPFSYVCDCQSKDGPIDFGSELNPEVRAAIDNSQQVIWEKIQKEKIRLASEELVDRTRSGDQNAAALMVMVKRNAEKGISRAVVALECMTEYAKQTPTRINGELGNISITKALAEEIKSDDSARVNTAINGYVPGMSFLQTVVTLSNGPELTKTRVLNLMIDYDGDEKKEFVKAFKNWGKPVKGNAGQIGKCVGFARAIQLVRKPNTPISVLGKKVSMELD